MSLTTAQVERSAVLEAARVLKDHDCPSPLDLDEISYWIGTRLARLVLREAHYRPAHDGTENWVHGTAGTGAGFLRPSDRRGSETPTFDPVWLYDAIHDTDVEKVLRGPYFELHGDLR